jgi:hypothetical protein
VAEPVRARRLTQDEGRRLQQLVRRGKHDSVRVRRGGTAREAIRPEMIASAEGCVLPFCITVGTMPVLDASRVDFASLDFLPSSRAVPILGDASTPAPVRIVDDSTSDGWEIVGVLTGLLVGLVSAFLAWRAVRIGQQANAAAVKAASEAERANEEASKARAAVAAERRRTFELEVLRDLIAFVDGSPRFARDICHNPALVLSGLSGRVSLLPEGDLPVWRRVAALTNAEDVADLLGVPQNDVRTLSRLTRNSVVGMNPSARLIEALSAALYNDLLTAVKKRMEDRDP